MTGRRAGIDVGGTKCLGVVIDVDAAIVFEQRRPTPSGPAAIIDTLADLVAEMGAIDSLGIGMPGLVTRDGTLLAAPNLIDITHFHIGDLLRERTSVEVHVDNDATCAAVAEWKVGVAAGADDAVMVTLGTGIGGGIVAGGRLLRGAHGFAGEIGHMVVDPDGPLCPCGRRGCWERFASGSALGRLAREAASDGSMRRTVELAGGDVAAVRGEHVQDAAIEGDAGALAVVADFARWVALGLVNLTNAFDPELFVLGGGLASSPQLYLPHIERWFTELLYSADIRPHPSLRFPRLGEHAGAVGAAMLVDVH
jgi:glucokinase